MGRRPSHVPTRARGIAACACLIAALLLTAASASGKKPPWAHGQANSHKGHSVTADTAQSPSAQSSIQTLTGKKSVSSSSSTQVGKGDGNDRGKGHNKGQDSASASAPAFPASSSTSSTPAPSAGTNAPQATTPPAAQASKPSPGGHGHARRAHRGRARRAAPSSTRARASGAATHPRATGSVQNATQRVARSSTAHAHPKKHARQSSAPAVVVRTLEHAVRVVPAFMKAIVAVLAFLVLVASIAWFFFARSAHYLKRQRQALLGEIGVLQAALLPEVPDEIGGLRPSVAYRPADGPAAGGDFYDAFPLEGGRVGIVIGDISGHGRDALMRTSLLRHTLRAYLDAGLQPREALQIGGRVLERGLEEIATVILATYDPSRHVLRYASAGHPPPLFIGPVDHPPVTQGSSPPIGAGVPTGLRQTTVALPPGSAICFFTDGLIEARRDGEMIGRLGLAKIISGLGPDTSARTLIDAVAAQVDELSDDMAACFFRVEGDLDVGPLRCEELELRRGDLPLAGRFLAACGVPDRELDELTGDADRTIDRYGGAIVRVTIGDRMAVADVMPANVERLVSAESRREAV
jgi:hypothetical protein